MPAEEVYQDVNHDEGASASDAGAVRTGQEPRAEFRGRGRGPAPGCSCTAPPPRPRPHLQCTTMGPAPGMLLWALFTSSRKPRTPEGSAGTPWSGQPKYW